MPVSPQDFALWSRMTGNPYPQSVAERVALAPQVYEFSKNIGKQNGPMGGVRGAIDTLGKIALAAGAVAGAGYLASKYGGGNPPPPPPSGGAVALPLDVSPDVPTSGPQGMGGRESQVVRASQDITPPPTSDLYGQDIISNQTSLVQQIKGLSPQKPTQVSSESKPATQSEVIASRQTFSPGTEAEMIGEDAVQKAIAFRKSKAYDVMQGKYPGLRDTDEEMLGGAEITPAPQVSSTNVIQPVAAQAASQMSQPGTVSVARPTAVGPSQEEIRDLDKTLLLAHGATTNRIQREAMRDEVLAKKYGGQSEPETEYVGTGQKVSTGMQIGTPKEFLRQKAAAASPLDAARQNIAIRKQLSSPTSEFQNLGYSTQKSDTREYDPHYLGLLQSHLDAVARGERGERSVNELNINEPGSEELSHYRAAYGRAFPAHFQY